MWSGAITYIAHVCCCPKTIVDKENAVCGVEASILTGPLDKYRLTIKCWDWAGKEVFTTQDQSGFTALVVHVVAKATLRGNMNTDWRVKLYCTLRSSRDFY